MILIEVSDYGLDANVVNIPVIITEVRDPGLIYTMAK